MVAKVAERVMLDETSGEEASMYSAAEVLPRVRVASGKVVGRTPKIAIAEAGE